MKQEDLASYNKTLLTTRQAADRANVARVTILSAIRRKRLRAVWSPQFGCWLIQPADLKKWQHDHNPTGGYPKGRPRGKNRS